MNDHSLINRPDKDIYMLINNGYLYYHNTPAAIIAYVIPIDPEFAAFLEQLHENSYLAYKIGYITLLHFYEHHSTSAQPPLSEVSKNDPFNEKYEYTTAQSNDNAAAELDHVFDDAFD